MSVDLSELPRRWRHARVRRVLTIAEQCLFRSQRLGHWWRTKRALERALVKQGHPASEIARHVATFRQAVREEREWRDFINNVQIVDRRQQRRACKGKVRP